jgi:hypothetical protein
VVSTPIGSVQEFKSVIAIASNAQEWSAMIKRALAEEENRPARRRERQEVARRYDWEGLVNRIALTIANRLELGRDGSRAEPARDSEISTVLPG